MNNTDFIIKDTITQNIKNQNAVFVFPTQICATLWADKSLFFSGVKSVALERFVAWDDFKGESIRSQHQDKNSIPSTLRTIFAHHLVKLNSEKPFFKNIIAEKYAEEADGFAGWIASLLPSLSMWKLNMEKSGESFDDEDNDLMEIYLRYSKFLDENNLFDPAWELPPFNSNGNHYFIFFPEILMDFIEYKNILESSKDITLVNIPQTIKTENTPEVHFYSNSRIELKEVANYLNSIHKEKKVEWNNIAISVPDLETYGPYLERELALYQIPAVTKNGKSLTQAQAGNLFIQIQNCVSDNFSFESMKNLLLNKSLPWKEMKKNNSLIRFGQANNCLCSYKENGKQIDVWEESFRNPIKNSYSEDIANLYKTIKSDLSEIYNAKSFNDIRTSYFKFREHLFDMSQCSPVSNRIISRCISELGALIDLEKKFGQEANPDKENIFDIKSFYSFFVEFIKGKNYVPQNDSSGVNILPYRTACAAPFDVHVVIDASQSGISVIYKRLSFLNDHKRKLLNLSEDPNVTEDFIYLYYLSSQKESLFTASEKTFSSYSLSNSYLKEKDHRPEKQFASETFIKDDFYIEEKKSLVNQKPKTFPKKLFATQKNGFDFWTSLLENKISEPDFDLTLFNKGVNDYSRDNNNLIRVSQSQLKKFYECPKSYLFEKILGVEKSDNAAELIDPYRIGNINHAILERYLKDLKKAGLDINVKKENTKEGEVTVLPPKHQEILNKAISDGINFQIASHLAKQIIDTSELAIKEAITESIIAFSTEFDTYSVEEIEKEYTLPVEEKNYYLYAKIDCLLKSPDDKYILIDFKSTENSVPSGRKYYHETNCPIPDFQLPLYKYVIENQNVDEPDKILISKCAFYSIREQSFLVLFDGIKQDTSTKDGEKREEKRKIQEILFNSTQYRCLELADEFAKSISNFDFVTESINVDDESCGGCDYKPVCRRIFNIAPKID